MKELTIKLFTKEAAENYCETVYGTHAKTKIVPVTICEDGIFNTYYLVFIELDNNRWTPVQNIKPEYVRE